MNIAGKIANTLRIGGIVIVVSFSAAIIAGVLALPFASILAGIGVAVTAATPIAGVIVAAIYLYKAGETKYSAYALILLIMMLLAGIWRLSS